MGSKRGIIRYYFSGIISAWNFSVICMKLKEASNRTELCFEKNFNLKFLRQKGPKMQLFKFREKSLHETFLSFCMKLQQHKCLKLIDSNDFGGKSCTMFFFRYFNFQPSFKLRWITNSINTGGFELRISCIRFAVQTLLWSLELVIQINLKHCGFWTKSG